MPPHGHSPLAFARKPGWATVGTAYGRALAKTRPIQPVPPLTEAAMHPWGEYLTAPPAHFDTLFGQALRPHRPSRHQLAGGLRWTLPTTVPATQPVTDLLDVDAYCVCVLEGGLWAFGTEMALPPPVAETMMAGLRTGWIQPLRDDLMRDGIKTPLGLPAAFGPLPTVTGPGTLDLAAFVHNRQTRWASPLQAAVSLTNPASAWLHDYPELLAWLRTLAEFLEPNDLRLLQQALAHVATPKGRLTRGQIDGVSGLVQGLCGEIAHRPAVVAHLREVQITHPHAILLTERDLSTPRGRQTSDVLIATIDPHTSTLHLQTVFELTSSLWPGTATDQMRASVDDRFVHDGLTLRGGANWATIPVTGQADATRVIRTTEAIAHATLRTLAAQTIDRAQRLGRGWLSVVRPDHDIPAWMTAQMFALVETAARQWQQSGAVRGIPTAHQALHTLAAEYPAYGPAWHILTSIFENYYGLRDGGRLSAPTLAQTWGVADSRIRQWERRLDRLLRPLDFIPVLHPDSTITGHAVGRHLQAWLAEQPPGHRLTPDIFLHAVRDLAAQHPEGGPSWRVLQSTAENLYGLRPNGRISAASLALGLAVTPATVSNWERRLTKALAPLGLTPVAVPDLTVAGTLATQYFATWAATQANGGAHAPETLLAMLRHLAEQHPEAALAWPVMIATAENLYGLRTGGRVSQSKLAAELGITAGTTVGHWEWRLTKLLAPLGLTPAAVQDLTVAGKLATQYIAAWATQAKDRAHTPQTVLSMLRHLAGQHPDAALAWPVMIAVTENLYGLRAGRRVRQQDLGRELGLSSTGIGSMERRLKKILHGRGLQAAPVAAHTSAGELAARHLRDWVKTEEDGGSVLTPAALHTKLRALAARHPEATLAWPIMLTTADNLYGLRPGGRISKTALAQELGASRPAISGWERRLIDLLTPLGLTPVDTKQ